MDVVLVDEQGQPVGSAPKNIVHTAETPLHLAFSCHVLNGDGEVLMTRRALSKKPGPGYGPILSAVTPRPAKVSQTH